MNTTAFITGGTSGIGAAFAALLAQRGYDIVIIGRRVAALESTAEEIRRSTGRRVETVSVELADPDERHRLCTLLGERTDVEFLINNAGFGLSAPFDSEHAGRHLEMLAVHVTA